MVVSTSSPGAAAASFRAALTAFTTASEVTVAPDRASTPSPMATVPDLPINCWIKAASSAQRVPKPGVSLAESITMEAMAPFSTVMVTVTSLWKPPAVPVKAAGAEAGAASAALMAFTTASEVTVAPVRASMPSPMAKGPVLPTNCSIKAASSAQRVPKPGVSLEESMFRAVTAPVSSRETSTVTSLWKPPAVPLRTSPVMGAEGAAGFSAGAPKATRGDTAGSFSRATLVTQCRALLTASSTALEVTVAPDRASKEPPLTASMPTNWSWNDASLARVPKPGVSAKLVSPTAQPVTRPSGPTPRVTATSPP